MKHSTYAALAGSCLLVFGAVSACSSGSGTGSGTGSDGGGSDGSGSGSGSSSGGSSGSSSGSGSGSSSGSSSGGSSGSSSGGTDAGSGFGQGCTSSNDCKDPVYNSCQMINHVMICTKACPNGSSDCPNPPTSGTCNGMGFCK